MPPSVFRMGRTEVKGTSPKRNAGGSGADMIDCNLDCFTLLFVGCWEIVFPCYAAVPFSMEDKIKGLDTSNHDLFQLSIELRVFSSDVRKILSIPRVNIRFC